MDAIELARQRAYELHLRAVSEGRDPWSPYEFSRAEASSRGITIEKCEPGAPTLDGARAVFDREYQLILHENVGTIFEQAFLVAHEIGHAELGDDVESDSDTPIDIDLARSAENASVGMDRVVDYSRRQRREVQMDLFAREFLLPRPVAKRLHIERGMSCSAIAERLGAPFEVVAQQLFDALLLPPVEHEVEASAPEIPLNTKQRLAAQHRGKPFLLQAGPGTGKTRTLVARVEGLLDEGVDPRRILLLTFSNKAAAEMAERIAQKRPEEAAALWIGTFHGFGLDLLRRFNDLCGLPADPKLMDRTEAVELLEHEFTRLGLVHYRNLYDPSQTVADILSAISRAKDEVVDAERYLHLATTMAAKAQSDIERELAEKSAEVARVYTAYEAIKAQQGCVDFGDLVMLPVLLLEREAEVRLQLQEKYDHILVDEYQDVNRSSVRLLTALKPDGTNLWVVGDAKQSIYRFRGASSFSMARFGKEDFAGGDSDNLEINYRSTPEIVGTFSSFAVGMASAGPLDRLTSDRSSSGKPPEIRAVTHGALMTPALADCIEEMKVAGIRYRDQAVLCKGNDRLAEVGLELERLGIPVLYLGSLFERPEVKDLMALLSLLVDRRAMGLVRTSCWPDFAMSMEDTVTVFDHLRHSEAEPGAWAADITGVSADGKSALTALQTALQGFDSASNPWLVLAYILLDRTRLASSIASSGTVADQARGIAIWQFMNFVRVQPRGQGLPIPRLTDRMRRLLRLRDDRDLRQLPAAAQKLDAVRLMTIHGSKGLEFPVVHISGINQDTVPGAFRRPPCPPPDGMIAGGQDSSDAVIKAGHLEEQECLFYVAMSRAKDRLFFYGATQTNDGKRRNLSDYLKRLAGVAERSIQPVSQLPLAPDQVPLAVSFSGAPRFTSDAIALFETCGRRFLYTHLLQVGGKRRTTAFMQMHEAVRTVYRSVVAAGNAPLVDWEAWLEHALVEQGLHEHGYVDDFRGLAKGMLRYFLQSRAGATSEPPPTLAIAFEATSIEVRLDDVLVRDGVRTLRRVKTGHSRSGAQKDVGAAAFLLAAGKAFPDANVELVHLADGEATPLTLSARELDNREKKLKEMLVGIRAGRFRATRSEFTCPGCPAFFICGETPPGTIVKSFEK